MMLAGFLFLLLITGGSVAFNDTQNDEGGSAFFNDTQNNKASDGSAAFNGSRNLRMQQKRQQNQDKGFNFESECTQRDVLEYLTLNKLSEISMVPPSSGSRYIYTDLLLNSILDVNEKDQLFVSSIWVDLQWWDDGINWEPWDFCDIEEIYLPTTAVWKPDITIVEMTEKDKALPSPYLRVDFTGEVRYKESMVVVTTCKMEVYKFPFDVQKCNLSLKSDIFSVSDMILVQFDDVTWNVEESRKKTQLEWLFLNMTRDLLTIDYFGIKQYMYVHTITMKRRSALYVANVLVPVIFFLCLDLASFMISERSGEKLGFKVTVLLAITVMQLILNDILPSSSDRIPLIVVYCIGIFGLMMISLVETMFVMYLMEKDNDEENHTTASRCCGGLKTQICCVCVSDVTVDETPEEPTVEQKDNSSQQTEENVSNEPTVMLSSKKEEGKAGYWTQVAKIFNRVFFICYVITAITFLCVLFVKWLEDE